MIKLSVIDAYQGMDEIDFSVMDDETYHVSNSDNRGGRVVSRQFFLDHDGSIVLEFYWDDEKVHVVRFHNKAELTERGKMRLAEQKQDEEEKTMNWNFESLDLLGAVREVQTDCQVCKIAINHNNGGEYWKKRYNRMVEIANNLRALIAYDDPRFSEPYSTEKYTINEPQREEPDMRLKEKIHDVTFHLDVESNYNESTEGKGKKDAVIFTMGQYTEYTDKYTSLDASVSTTAEDARAFAEAILRACDDIEGVTTIYHKSV